MQAGFGLYRFFSDAARGSGGTTELAPAGHHPRDKGGLLALRIFNSNKPYIGAINGVAAGMGAALWRGAP